MEAAARKLGASATAATAAAEKGKNEATRAAAVAKAEVAVAARVAEGNEFEKMRIRQQEGYVRSYSSSQVHFT